jgi:hypothetical protein
MEQALLYLHCLLVALGSGGNLNHPSYRFLVVTNATEKPKVFHFIAITFDVVYIRSWSTAHLAATTIAGNHGLPNGGRHMTLSLGVPPAYNQPEPNFNRLSNIGPFYSCITDATTDVAHRLRFLRTSFGAIKLSLVSHDHALATIQAGK